MVCKRLIKFGILSTLVVGGAGYLMFGHGIGSYIATAFGDVKKAVAGSVPLDFELRRARTLIQKIDPEINEARRDVARAEVELDELDGQIRSLGVAIAKAETKMERHREYLRGEGDTVPVFGNGDYGSTAVKSELIRTFDMYRNQVDLMKSKRALRTRQAKVLEAARAKLVSVRSERNKLSDMITTLEARKRQLDAMAASTQRAVDLDTSNLSEAKVLLAGIKKRLDVSAKIIQEELFLSQGEVTGEADQQRDIIKEMDAYFGGKPETATTSATVGLRRVQAAK